MFISSTIGELAPEREAVARAISSVGLTPIMFELGARPYPPRELYRAYLAQSDIFVGLYWQRYGWVGPDMDISGLEDEFRLSVDLPRLLYVKTPAPDREPGLTAMLDEIKAKGTESYHSFKTPTELARLVHGDIAVLLSERFAAGAADRATAARDAPTSGPRGRSIPVPSTSLIGREHDVEAIETLLADPATRLITLTGPGGIGKTRLAIELAQRHEQENAGSVAFVALGTVTQTDQAVARIATAVGAAIEGAREPLDVVAEYLDDAPSLLVLDELEQIAGIAVQLDQLLTRCPGLRMIVTSRTLLRIRAERDYAVAPLGVPDYDEPPPLAQLAALPAVQLFVDRAKAARYDFALTADNALAVAEICRRLDGIPLAIELAAARARLLEPAALLERLGKSLDALGTGPVDLPERQRTLRATVEWSVGLLDDAQARMLATLSVFVGGWTEEAAVAVSGLDELEVLDLLDGLAGHSLVTVSVAGETPRFGMLTAVRELAAERLAAQADAPGVAQRHAEHYRHTVEAQGWPADNQAAWADRLAVEEGNLGVAVEWYLANDIKPLPHLLRILWLFWQLRDHLSEGNAWVERVMPHAQSLDVDARLELLIVCAMTRGEVGDDPGTLAAADDIKAVRPLVHNAELDGLADVAISWVLPIQGDVNGALQAATAAAAELEAQHNPIVAWAVFTAGLFELTLEQLDAAQASLTEARHYGERFNNTWLSTASTALLAGIAVRQGRLDEARATLDGVVQPSHVADISSQALTIALVSYAHLALADGNARLAAAALGAIDATRDRLGLRAWPSMRGNEAELARLVSSALGEADLAAARAAGATLTRAQSIALVRGEGLPGT